MSLFETRPRKFIVIGKIVSPSNTLLGVDVTDFLGERKRITLENANQLIAYGLIESTTLQNITIEECEEGLFIPDSITISQELSNQEMFLRIDRMINNHLEQFTRSSILKAANEYEREEEQRRQEVLRILQSN